MACERLQAKGDTKELEIHWTEQFLKRYLNLKSKYVSRLEEESKAVLLPKILLL